jgi:hypothetical protein
MFLLEQLFKQKPRKTMHNNGKQSNSTTKKVKIELQDKCPG